MWLVDADSICKKINESIKAAVKWESEAREKKDTHGVKLAIDTRRSLLAMLSRVLEEPTIDADPVKRGKWKCVNDDEGIWMCSNCGNEISLEVGSPAEFEWFFCPYCGAKMGGKSDGR